MNERTIALRQYWRGLMAIVCLLQPCAQAVHAANSTAPEESRRFAEITALGLPSIPGSMPAFYSPHAATRAKYLQSLLGGEIEYYSQLFHTALPPVTLAVLDTHAWPKVAGDEPYGMPSVEGGKPPVFVMPASWDEVRWMVVPRRAEVAPAMLRQALANGRTWERVKTEGYDGIGSHEIGHVIVRELGIDPQTKWFDEFLASFVGYAYLKARDSQQALSSEIFWMAGLKHSPHQFTALDDFDTRYDELQQRYPANYGWYQLEFDQRVLEIFGQYGVDYLRTIRQEFPAGAATLDGAALLTKLEGINPGWQAWALRLEAGGRPNHDPAP